MAIQAIERDGRIPVATSANCLQPDGHNDNGWDQGLLFLNPHQVWLQPPGWVTRMISRNYQPLYIPASVAGAPDLDVSAKRSEDGRTLVLQVVNVADHRQSVRINLEGFQPSKSTALVEELAGSLDVRNTAEEKTHIAPRSELWQHAATQGTPSRSFPAYSFTVIRFE